MKKCAKLMLLILISPFKLAVCFSIPDDIVSTAKLLADDKSIFSAVNDDNVSSDELNKDLQKISELVCKWKISFNPELRSDFF